LRGIFYIFREYYIAQDEKYITYHIYGRREIEYNLLDLKINDVFIIDSYFEKYIEIKKIA